MKFKFLFILLATLQAFGCDPNGTHLKSKTLHVGFNGLKESYEIQLFENKNTLQNSWLKNALTSRELIGGFNNEVQL